VKPSGGNVVGFRVRRSIKVAPGVRLNVSAKSVGLSAGVRGARVSVNSKGRVTRTVGVPGTGISHSKTVSIGAKRANSRPAQGVKSTPPPKPKKIKPGLMAPSWEKQLFKQLEGQPDAAAIHAVGQTDPAAAPTAAMVEVLRVAVPTNDSSRARALLGWLFNTGYDPATDSFVTRYLGAPAVSIPIATGIVAVMAWDRQAIGLLLAELEQEAGERATAINVVEQLEPTTVAAVSLAELYAEEGRWADIVDLTNGLTNEDEASTFLLIQRGTALREKGYFEAAREALKEALRIRSRPAELRHLALVARGHTYLAEGKKAMARKDYERVLAEDANYPGLQDMLADASA
jgi:predicted negative regulator of RcsB-dependent stress response